MATIPEWHGDPDDLDMLAEVLSLGYVTVGVIPGYALQVNSAQLEPTTIMYKVLPPYRDAARRH